MGAGALSLYAGAILVGALAGGALPLFSTVRRSDLLLSFSAGIMLGAAFLHMLPEAVEGAGGAAVPFVLVGFLLLYLLERFVLVHVCAEPGPNARLSTTGAPLRPDDPHDHHAGEDPHVHADGTGCDVHTVGLAAWIGMSVHTLVDGFALGAASVQPDLGALVFLAILAHKIPNSFSLSAILISEGYGRAKAVAMNAAFALMVPLGAGLYLLLREAVHVQEFGPLALAASAGTFLHLSLSDILPDLHRRGASRWRLSVAMVGGIAVMGALGLLRHGH